MINIRLKARYILKTAIEWREKRKSGVVLGGGGGGGGGGMVRKCVKRCKDTQLHYTNVSPTLWFNVGWLW